MRTLIATLACAVLTAGLIAVTGTTADAAGKFSVSVSASKTSLSLGSTFAISGSVSPNAKGQSVSIQEKRSGGAWRTITTKKLTSASKYAATIKPGTGGPTSYRVVKAAKGSRGAGISATRTIAVWRWRHLTDLTLGKPSGKLTFQNKGCTALTSIVGMGDISASDATGSTGIMITTGSGSGPIYGPRYFARFDQPRFYTTENGLANANSFWISANTASGSGISEIQWAEPMVYCNS